MVACAAIAATSVRRCSKTAARITPHRREPEEPDRLDVHEREERTRQERGPHEPHPATQPLEQEPSEVDLFAERSEAHRHHGVDHEPGPCQVLERGRARRLMTGDRADDLRRDRDHDRSREHGAEPRADAGEDVARVPTAAAQAERGEGAPGAADGDDDRHEQAELLRGRHQDGSTVRVPPQETEDEVVREQHQAERHQREREVLVEAPGSERPSVLTVRTRRDRRGHRPHRRGGERLDAHQPISTRRFRRSSAFSITRRAPSVRMNPGTRGPSSTAKR